MNRISIKTNIWNKLACVTLAMMVLASNLIQVSSMSAVPSFSEKEIILSVQNFSTPNYKADLPLANVADNKAGSAIEAWSYTAGGTLYPATLNVDLKENAAVISKIKIMPRYTAQTSLQNTILEASVDGDNWIQIYILPSDTSGVINPAYIEISATDFPMSVKGETIRYIRLMKDSAGSGSAFNLSLAEFKVYANKFSTYDGLINLQSNIDIAKLSTNISLRQTDDKGSTYKWRSSNSAIKIDEENGVGIVTTPFYGTPNISGRLYVEVENAEYSISDSFVFTVLTDSTQNPKAVDITISTNNVIPSKNVYVGFKMDGSYNYYSPVNSPQSIQNTRYRWCVADSLDDDFLPLGNADTLSYTIREEDIGKYIRFEVMVYAATEPMEGRFTPSKSYLVSYPEEEQKPYATNVVMGEPKYGESIVVSYNYNDLNFDTEQETKFKFKRYNEINGSFEIISEGITTAKEPLSIIMTEEDYNDKYITVEITPYDGKEYGAAVETVPQKAPAFPKASNVSLIGGAGSGGTLLTKYQYYDFNNDIEKDTSVKWLVSDSLDGVYTEISGINSNGYIVENKYVGKYIKSMVIPRSEKQPFLGKGVNSEPVYITQNSYEALKLKEEKLVFAAYCSDTKGEKLAGIKAQDGSADTYLDIYQNTSGEAYYKLNLGKEAYMITKLVIVPRAGFLSRIADLTLEVSNDNIKWDKIAITPSTINGTLVFEFADFLQPIASTSYKYLKLKKNALFSLAEIEVYASNLLDEVKTTVLNENIDISNIKTNISLPKVSKNGNLCFWEIPQNNVIENDGTVIRPIQGKTDEVVRIKLNAYCGGNNYALVFNLIVKSFIAVAPMAQNVRIEGDVALNNVLTGAYDYFDENNLDSSTATQNENNSKLKWVCSDKIDGNYVEIPNATTNTFTVTEEYESKFIKFMVQPISDTQPNEGIWYSSRASVKPLLPYATDIKIENIKYGMPIKASYLFHDDNFDSEANSGSQFRFLISPTIDGEYVLAKGNNASGYAKSKSEISYELAEDDLSNYMKLEIMPVSDKEPFSGEKAYSEAVLLPARPMASNIMLSIKNNNVMLDSYMFFDKNQEREYGTTFKWYISSTQEGGYSLIPNATNSGLLINDEVKGRFVKIEITPKTGTLPEGLPTFSSPKYIPKDTVIQRISSGGGGGGKISSPAVIYSQGPVEILAKEKIKDAIVLYLGSPYSYVNNNKVLLDEVNTNLRPIINNDRTMVPVRFVAEALGAMVEWNGDIQEIKISFSDKNIDFRIGDRTILINGETNSLDVPAQIVDGRTFFPIRAVSEIVGKNVFWDPKGLIVIDDKKDFMSSENDVAIIDYLVNDLKKSAYDLETEIMKSKKAEPILPTVVETIESDVSESGSAVTLGKDGVTLDCNTVVIQNQTLSKGDAPYISNWLADASVVWILNVEQDGLYEIRLVYSYNSDYNVSGSLLLCDQNKRFIANTTGDISSYATMYVDKFNIYRGQQKLVINSDADIRNSFINLKYVEIIPVK